MSVQHPEMAGQSVIDPVRLIDELKRIAVEQLGAVPSGLYRPIEERLHESLRTGSESAQRKDLMAVLALRQRGSGFVMKFRELIGRSFDDFCGRATVGRSDAPLGLVLEDIKPIARDRWRAVRVREAMRPVASDHFVLTGTPVADARIVMERNKTGALAVLDDASRIVGLLHHGSVRKRA